MEWNTNHRSWSDNIGPTLKPNFWNEITVVVRKSIEFWQIKVRSTLKIVKCSQISVTIQDCGFQSISVLLFEWRTFLEIFVLALVLQYVDWTIVSFDYLTHKKLAFVLVWYNSDESVTNSKVWYLYILVVHIHILGIYTLYCAVCVYSPWDFQHLRGLNFHYIFWNLP